MPLYPMLIMFGADRHSGYGTFGEIEGPLRLILLVICVGLLTGCAMQHDLVADNQVSIQTDAGANAMMIGPKLVQIGDNMRVSGAVMRKPGNDTPMAGHVEIVATDA